MKALVLALLPAALLAGQYPMEAGDLQRTNTRQAPSSIRGPLQEQWTIPASTGLNHPLLTDDKVIIVNSGSVRAYQRSDGTALWSQYSPYSVKTGCLDKDRGLLYIPSSSSYAGSYYPGLSAIRISDGSQAWTWRDSAPSAVANYCSPSLLPEGLVVASGLGSLVDIDPDSHLTKWTRPLNEALNTPAYDGGKLYVAGRAGTLACVNASDGSIVWTLKTANAYSSAVTLGPELFYVMVNVGRVEARRRSDGSLAWVYSTLSFSSSNLALCGDSLVASSDDRIVHCLNANTGERRWWVGFAGNFARCAPLIICGKVFISGCAGSYYGLDLRTGAKIWIYYHDAFNSFVDWSVDGDQSFVTDAAGRLHCFKALEPEDPATCACLVPETPTPAVTPTPVAGPCDLPGQDRLIYWIRGDDAQAANGTLVDSWPDHSGHRHLAIAASNIRPSLTAPDVNGERSVYFDGTNKYMTINRPNEDWVKDPRNFTFLVKARCLASVNYESFLFGGSNYLSNDYFNLGLHANNWYVNGWITPAPVTFNQKLVVAYRSSAAGQVLRVNGAQVASAGPAFQSDVVTGQYLGNMVENPGTYFKGNLYTVMIFDGALSDQELSDWETCLMDPSWSVTPSATATATPTASPTLTVTETLTATPTASPTLTATETFTDTPTASPSPSPTATATPTEGAFDQDPVKPSPTLTFTVQPDLDCGASIEKVQVSPNPQTACTHADRMVSVKLGCSADEIDIEVYSQAGVLLFRWVETDKHVQKGQWVHSRYPHDVDLGNGVYFVKVTAKKGETQDHAATTFMVLK